MAENNKSETKYENMNAAAGEEYENPFLLFLI